jgi:hypothetical protein
MSSNDHITIDAHGASLDDVAAIVLGIGGEPYRDGDYLAVMPEEGLRVSLSPADLVDDGAVDWSSFSYSVAVSSRDAEAQERMANAIYDHLVDLTDWALVLSFDERLSIRARRRAIEHV